MLGRRRKEKDKPKSENTPDQEAKRGLQRAEEAYLNRLARSIQTGDPYVRPAGQGGALSPQVPNQPPPAPDDPTDPIGGFELDAPSVSGPLGPPPLTPAPAMARSGAVSMPSRPATSHPQGQGQAQPARPAPRREPANAPKPEGSFQPGTVLELDDGTLWVYKEPVRGKEYEIVYSLRPNGRAVPQGLALFAYKAVPLGTLPPEFLAQLQIEQRWTRDAIIYHLDAFEFCARVPYPDPEAGDGLCVGYANPATPPPVAAPKSPAPSAVAPQRAPMTPPPAPPPRPSTPPTKMPSPPPSSGQLPPSQNREMLSRGRRVIISFGPGKSWDAVYWGRDVLGVVVAHRTHEHWALMHLDLDRFKDGIEYGGMITPTEVTEIESDISSSVDYS